MSTMERRVTLTNKLGALVSSSPGGAVARTEMAALMESMGAADVVNDRMAL